MNLSLLNNLIVFPVVNNEATLVSGDIHSFVEETPRGLRNNVILRSLNFLLPIWLLIQGILEVISTDE